MHRFSAALVGVVSAIAFTQIAAAADLPRKAPAYAPPPPPVLSWTGWYVGVNAGWVGSNGDVNTNAGILTTSTAPINATNIAAGATNQLNNRFDGFIGGAQFGYNYQFAPAWVVGFEADIQGTSLDGNLGITSTTGTGPFWVAGTTVSNQLDYLGTLRGRIGVTVTPSFLLYGTGGLAYGGVKSNTLINFTNTGGGVPGSTAGSLSDTRVGWTAGAGIEWMFVRNWSAKLEYLHYDLGSATYTTGGYAVNVGPTGFPGTGIASVATSTTVHFNGDIVRVGLNYLFH